MQLAAAGAPVVSVASRRCLPLWWPRRGRPASAGASHRAAPQARRPPSAICGPTAEGAPRHLAKEQVNQVHSAPMPGSPGRRALAVILAIIGVLAIIAGILYVAGAANSLHFPTSPGNAGNPRPAGAWPAGGRRRRAPRRESRVEHGRPHDQLPSWPTAAPAQPTGSPRSSTSRPAPAAYWSPSSPSEPTTPAKWAIVLHARPPRNRTVQQRLCPKLIPGARSSHDRAPDQWDRGERIGQRGRWEH